MCNKLAANRPAPGFDPPLLCLTTASLPQSRRIWPKQGGRNRTRLDSLSVRCL